MTDEHIYCIHISLNRSRTQEEAEKIAYNLEVVPKNEADERKIFWNPLNTEVEEEEDTSQKCSAP